MKTYNEIKTAIENLGADVDVYEYDERKIPNIEDPSHWFTVIVLDVDDWDVPMDYDKKKIASFVKMLRKECNEVKDVCGIKTYCFDDIDVEFYKRSEGEQDHLRGAGRPAPLKNFLKKMLDIQARMCYNILGSRRHPRGAD